MAKLRSIALLAAALLLSAPSLPLPQFSLPSITALDRPTQGHGLSVLTYNVKGLPWPAARNRHPAIAAIGDSLRLMRSQGVQPRVVLLQEAFVDEAKGIGRVAGYPYMAVGPISAPLTAKPPLGGKFAAAEQWLKGERSSNIVDSGLVVLSDYPIVRSRRFAFPKGACAGFDCLAAKGVLVAWIKVPGARQPVAVANTHLNSRHAASVPEQRADEANAWQIGAVRKFLSSAVTAETPLILGGDLNIGQAEDRQEALDSQPLIGNGQTDGLAAAVALNEIIPSSIAEAGHILERNKDRILSRDGNRTNLLPYRAWVPFPMSTVKKPMSDHAGFVVEYRVRLTI